jgi:type I restriction enzyme S subunit
MKQGKLLYETKELITSRSIRECNCRQIPAETALLSFKLSIGKVGISKVPLYTNEAIAALPIKDKERLDLHYLYWALRSLRLSNTGNRAAMGLTLNKSALQKLRIPLPAIEEQRRIAETLDRAEELRDKRREALAEFDELAESIFLEEFGDPASGASRWAVRPFGELVTSIDSGQSPKCHSRPAEAGEWGVLKLGAVTRCEYDPSENKALPSYVTPAVRHEVKKGDLLFTRKNTYELVAACALVRNTPPRMLLPDLIFRIQLKSTSCIDPRYLHRLLIHPSKRRMIQSLAGGSAGSMPNISKFRLRAVPIEIPPFELQENFACRIEVVERLQEKQRAHLVELDALFESLQHRAFRGEL